MDSRQSIVRFHLQNQSYISVNLFIQMEYCSQNNLQTLIENRKVADRFQNFRLFSQLVAGVHSIHSNQMVHRDLKP